MIINVVIYSSYRTYEEWKQPLPSNALPLDSSVLTVPMRNGNRSLLIPAHTPFFVLTVPMRNGNRTFFKDIVPEYSVLTVPMRNGNLPVYELKR